MRPFGTRSLSLILIFAVTVGFAFHAGLFRLGTLEGVTSEVSVCLGVFTVLVGTWLYRIWDLGSASRSYLRVSRGAAPRLWEGEQTVLKLGRVALVSGVTGLEPPRELPSLAKRLGAQAICLLVGLLCFNARTVPLMIDTPRRLANAGAQYCPPPEGSKEEIKPPEKPGCELVLRAYKLGYVKDLGTCAPDDKDKKLELCTLRQVDEPYLHWSFRLFSGFVGKVEAVAGGPDFMRRQRAALEIQLKHRQTLVGEKRSVVSNAPKSSHHIFTNLPYPNGKLADVWESWFKPNECFTRYRKLSHTTEPAVDDQSALSRVVDHVYGHLLFDPKYDEAIGDCKEYHIHWGSPDDSCERLAREPEKFLTEHDAIEPIRAVLDRYRQREDLKKLDYELSTARGDLVGPKLSLRPKREESGVLRPRAVVEPETIVSFQCFMRAQPSARAAPRTPDASTLVGPVRPGTPLAGAVSFDLLGTHFSAPSFHFPSEAGSRRVNVDLYRELSGALAEGFTYTGYLSRSGSANATGMQIGAETLTATGGAWEDFSLSRLEVLKSADVFLGNDWLQSREDLLEVYPYYQHLYHFVQLFREKYRLQRTHL